MNRTFFRPAALILASSGALSACSYLPSGFGGAGADSAQPVSAAATALSAETDSLASRPWAFGRSLDRAVITDWAMLTGNTQIAALIQQGLTANPSLRAGAESIVRADAQRRIAEAARSPFLSFSTGANLSSPLEDADLRDSFSAALTASWEADIWGRLRTDIATAELDLLSARAFHESARQSLAAEVARAALSAIEFQQQAAVTRETVEALEETLRLVRVRFDEGFSPRLDVVLAESDLASAQDTLVSFEAAARASKRRLNILTGQYPDAVVDLPAQFPNVLVAAPTGTPGDLLASRPDLLGAAFAVQAAFSDVASVEAGRWPELSISGGLSGSGELEDLIDPAGYAVSLGLRLANSLFDGGLTRARVDLAGSGARQAVADLGARYLTALSEVEGRLDDIETLARRRVLQETAARAARESLRLAEIRFREGDIDLLDVLDFRQRAFAADRSLITLAGDEAEARIALYLALGGDMSGRPAAN
jgi:NodT family efflux transporter outer membrane factor (OMF) lipoprotein